MTQLLQLFTLISNESCWVILSADSFNTLLLQKVSAVPIWQYDSLTPFIYFLRV